MANDVNQTSVSVSSITGHGRYHAQRTATYVTLTWLRQRVLRCAESIFPQIRNRDAIDESRLAERNPRMSTLSVSSPITMRPLLFALGLAFVAAVLVDDAGALKCYEDDPVRDPHCFP